MKAVSLFFIVLVLFSPLCHSENLWKYNFLTAYDEVGTHQKYISDTPKIEKGSATIKFDGGNFEIVWRNEYYPEEPEVVARGGYDIQKDKDGKKIYYFKNAKYINSELVEVELWGEFRSINVGRDCYLERVILSDKFFIEGVRFFSRQVGDCTGAGQDSQ
jgi:hypothetical protein